MTKDKKTATKKEPIGGISFFSSYLVLILLTISNTYVLAQVLLETELLKLIIITSGGLVGWWIAYTLFRGQISVLIHEYKHAILAKLVGNKWKRLKLKGMGGSFKYSYTQETARYNAFISLAPYFLPVLTFIGSLFFVTLMYRSIEAALLVIGIMHGAELYFNWRDANPIQTDLTDIRGGFWVAFGYVVVANIVITSLVLIAALGGLDGLEKLMDSLWVLATLVVAAVRAVVIRE
jgi:hypothetical protein